MNTQPNRAGSFQLGITKYLYLGYFVAGSIVAYLVSHLVEALWIGHDDSANVIGTVVGVVCVVLAWRNQRLRALAMETIEELAAVTWPTKQETIDATMVVLGASVVSTLIIFGLDRFWNWFTNLIYLSE